MTFGINGAELIILILLAVLVLGPEKLPEYARKLTEWIRNLRTMAEGAKTQFKEETGTDFDEIDWKRYDPRQYDPRRIIRDALSEPVEGDTQGAAAASVSGSSSAPSSTAPSSTAPSSTAPSSTAPSSTAPPTPRDGLRGDLHAARRQRDALRDDLEDMDPRALLFGPSSRRPASSAGAAAATTAAQSTVSEEDETTQDAETTEADVTGTPSVDRPPAPFDSDAT